MEKSILIIDDDSDVRNTLKHVLECHDYKVYEASNGKEGIESYRRINTDIVLTDIFMPEQDGLEAIREIKREFPEAKIIAMSGIDKGKWDFLKIAGYLGATDCIRKPFAPEDIIRMVESALEGKAGEEITKIVSRVSDAIW
ncbi:MAG: response regulator [Dissulfurispiraceae bacterium]